MVSEKGTKGLSDPLVNSKSFYVIFYNVVWTSHIVYNLWISTFFVQVNMTLLQNNIPRDSFLVTISIGLYRPILKITWGLFSFITWTWGNVLFAISLIRYDIITVDEISLQSFQLFAYGKRGNLTEHIIEIFVWLPWINIAIYVSNGSLINFTIMVIWHKNKLEL